MKTEYVPVTSFIHTANFRNFKRIFQANNTPADYYLNDYGTGVGASEAIPSTTRLATGNSQTRSPLPCSKVSTNGQKQA